MNNKTKLTPSHIDRRQFLKLGSAFAASTFLLPLQACSSLRQEGSAANIPSTQLNNSLSMPMMGFGTNTLNDETCVRCVSDAISVGYRLFDTATIYGNEKAVGEGIKQSGIEREKLFITSKVWVDDSGYEKTKQAFETSINKLATNYLDLYLVHRPRGDVKGTWQAIEELYNEGKIKAIGISNFEAHQLDELMTYATVKPVLNQIENNVFFQQAKAEQYLTKNKVQTQAWAPLADGRNGIFSNPILAQIGKKYNKSNAQISLRWHYQRGIVAIPRTSQKAHMIENLAIFDFELSNEDMQALSVLDLNKTQFPEWS